ncbi:DUF2007 domain-containing protein [Tissierella sp. Yu-01]|uniref:putative signal transducing protein n=1 Tax=Tissierella sp. Yu-01 TaxID=3035694 RepID=UPI00240E564E|nr:DUF2007 domain-containing protein [Tissierella sp. Yu-01]WFA10161.1 DUF2007 domain-containing protein [Tissierella sp. Yu-01]
MSSQKEKVELVLLKTANNNFELDIIKGVLEDNQIPYLIQEKGIGSYMKIITGNSIYGTDIFVDKSVYETARNIIDSIF